MRRNADSSNSMFAIRTTSISFRHINSSFRYGVAYHYISNLNINIEVIISWNLIK